MTFTVKLTFTDQEKIDVLESMGWTILTEKVDLWVQTGPYDNIGEYETTNRYYAIKFPDSPREDIDSVFREVIEQRLKTILLKPI